MRVRVGGLKFASCEEPSCKGDEDRDGGDAGPDGPPGGDGGSCGDVGVGAGGAGFGAALVVAAADGAADPVGEGVGADGGGEGAATGCAAAGELGLDRVKDGAVDDGLVVVGDDVFGQQAGVAGAGGVGDVGPVVVLADQGADVGEVFQPTSGDRGSKQAV